MNVLKIGVIKSDKMKFKVGWTDTVAGTVSPCISRSHSNFPFHSLFFYIRHSAAWVGLAVAAGSNGNYSVAYDPSRSSDPRPLADIRAVRDMRLEGEKWRRTNLGAKRGEELLM